MKFQTKCDVYYSFIEIKKYINFIFFKFLKSFKL